MPGPFERCQYIIGREIFIGHWLAVPPIKTFAAIRRIPLVAFGPHLNEEALDRVRSAGAAKMLLGMRQWIEPLPDVCRGVDVRALKAQLRSLAEELESVGPEGIARLDRSLLRPIPLTGD